MEGEAVGVSVEMVKQGLWTGGQQVQGKVGYHPIMKMGGSGLGESLCTECGDSQSFFPTKYQNQAVLFHWEGRCRSSLENLASQEGALKTC